MKAIVVAAVSLAVVIGVVIYEEGRIATLERELAELREAPANLRPGGGSRGTRASAELSESGGAKGDRTGSRVGAVAGTDSGDGEKSEGDWAQTFRQMIENPVGAAMMKEETKVKAVRVFGDFIDSLELNKEEKEYFLGLVAAGVNEEDMIGMKLFAAKSDEERSAILDQMEADQEARRQAIKDFLNNDDDFARYEHFEERKEIHEQMPGLRAAMNETGAPISPQQEEQLVEAVYQASLRSGMNENWDGRAGLEQFARPGATQRFKDQWAAMQTVLNSNLGAILGNPDQQAAFREHQNQVGNMITFGLQFAEGMIANQRGGGEE